MTRRDVAKHAENASRPGAAICKPVRARLHLQTMTDSTQAPHANPSLGPSRPALVLTALGPDRPGIVKEIASYVRRHGGNIEDTRMSKLGGEFAVLVLITGQDESISKLEQSLSELDVALGISCFMKRTLTSPPSGTLYQLEASGFDQPGIVESVSQVLAEKGVNVTSFSSRVENVPLTGTAMFFLDAQISLPEGMLIRELDGALSAMCERENLEYILQQA